MKNLGTKRLETDRLVLRRFVMEDATDMYQNWASEPEVTRFLTWPAHKDVETSKNILQDWIKRYDNNDFYNWAIELKETNEVIGNISVVKLNETTEAADISARYSFFPGIRIRESVLLPYKKHLRCIRKQRNGVLIQSCRSLGIVICMKSADLSEPEKSIL